MEFCVNVNLNDLYNKSNLKVEKINKIIRSKNEEIKELEKFRDDIIKERNDISKEIQRIKKDINCKNEKAKEKKNLTSPLHDEMEDNSPAKIHEYGEVQDYLKDEYKDEDIDYDLKNCDWFEDDSFNFGDILDKAGNRHYGYTFVGKNGILENTNRNDAIDGESGVTVPFNICKYLTDSVSKYSNFKYDQSCIVAYELPYYDTTVQKYKVEKNHMYEYTCWNEEIEDFTFDKWTLVQINIETGKRTYPKLKLTKKKLSKKSSK
jgi:hypothetical protein